MRLNYMDKKEKEYLFLAVLEKCYSNNNKREIARYEWLSVFWLGGTKTQTTRRKNLQIHSQRSQYKIQPHPTANHKLIGVNGVRPHSSDEQNSIKIQGLPLVDGKECHFALRGGNYIRQALDCNCTANAEPPVSTPLSDAHKEGSKKHRTYRNVPRTLHIS